MSTHHSIHPARSTAQRAGQTVECAGQPAQRGLPAFILLALGQSVSLFGSSLTGFALGLQAYQQSGQVSIYGLIALAAALPRILLSPLAGRAADRAEQSPAGRLRLMLLADLGAALVTLAAALLWWSGALQPWHVYLITAASAAFGAFQFPAYAATTAQLVQGSQLSRANGIVQLGTALVEVLAPAAAGALYVAFGVPVILLIDFTTFLLAAASTLAVVRIVRSLPASDSGRESTAGQTGPAREKLAGIRLIKAYPGLAALLGFMAVFSLFWGTVPVLASPYFLSLSDPRGLGLVLTVAGGGMLTGSLAMTALGPKASIRRLAYYELATGVCFVLIGARPVVVLIAAAAFGAHFLIAFIEGTTRTLLQERVEPHHQGQVFGLWQMVVSTARLLAYLLTGLLADRLFEPQMLPGAPLADVLSPLLGAGPGRGMGLMFVLMGLCKMIVAPAIARFSKTER